MTGARGEGLGSLYPDWLLKANVGALTVPGLRDPRATGIPNAGDVASYYGENVQGRSSSGFLVYVRKAYPHSPFDCLVVTDASPRITSSLADLTHGQWREIANTVDSFLTFCQRSDVRARFNLEGGQAHVSFNFAGRRQDREDSMFYDRRLHVHLNFFDAPTLARTQYAQLGSLPAVSRVRLVDPATWMAERMAPLLVRRESPLRVLQLAPQKRGATAPSAVGIRFSCPASSFATREVAEDLRAVHRMLDAAYVELESAFVPRQRTTPWCRARLRPRGEILERLAAFPFLDGPSFGALSSLATLLRNHPDHVAVAPDEVPVRLILPDLDYSVVLHRVADTYQVLFQPRIFSDSGSAGTPALGSAIAVKLTRSSTHWYSPDDEAVRESFREGFLAGAHR